MKEHTMVLIDKINHHVSQSGDEKCAVLDTRKLMLPLTFDIICGKFNYFSNLFKNLNCSFLI